MASLDLGKMGWPGAQGKTEALCRDNKHRRWGAPSGRASTAHIIRPSISGFKGHVETEHLCQAIPARLGLLGANSSVLALGDASCIVIERFYRLPPVPGSTFVQRGHKEDMSQVLGLMPGRKYQ